MAFWTRARQLSPKSLPSSNKLKRGYTLPQASLIADRPFYSSTFSAYLNNDLSVNHKRDFFFNVRFFAAPAQVFQKKEEKDSSGPRLNEHITAPFLRLVTDEGHRVVSRSEALKLAKHLKLDVVEVDRISNPPVCKIVDYHKEKYLRQMKEKERAKKKTELKSGAFKEVKFGAKINHKDLQMKADMVKRLMESGHRVKCTAVDPTNDLDLETLLSRFSALIKDVAFEESAPKVEKKQAFVVVRHIKFGPSKKGSGKKVLKVESKGDALSADGMSGLTTPNGSSSSKENERNHQAGTATVNAATWSLEMLNENGEANEFELFNGDGDLDANFDVEDYANKPAREDQPGIVTEKLPTTLEENSGIVLEFAPPQVSSSAPVDIPKQRIENRYARDPGMLSPSKVPASIYERGGRNTMNRAPSIPEYGKQTQYSMNPSPQMRFEVPAHETPNQASPRPGFGNSQINSYGPAPAAGNRADKMFQVANQRERVLSDINALPQQRTSLYVDEVPRRLDSPYLDSRDSPAKSYGIFSSQGVSTPCEERAPAENNRYRKRDPTNSPRSRESTAGDPPPDFRIGGLGVDNSGEGRWGRFSTR